MTSRVNRADVAQDCPGVMTRQLRRVFGTGGQQRVALEGADLVIGQAEIHGLLGPNGAGKTTLCKILSTVLLPTSGSAAVLGHDVAAQPRAVRSLIGIMFGGERGLYTRLTARQNLMYWSALYRQPRRQGKVRTSALLERVGLGERADERVETYSRGMKQRLHLARCLIGDPMVVILDEPTTGMDPVAARELRSLIRELRDDGRTVLLTTHDMAEAETICDRVTLIDKGKLLTTADPAAIGQVLSAYERITADEVPADAVERIRKLPDVASVTVDGGSIAVEVTAKDATNLVLRELVTAGVSSMTTKPPSLEEVYLHLIGDRGLSV